MSIDTHLHRIQTLLRLEQEAVQINSLEQLADSQRRRATMNELWQAIHNEFAPISQTIEALPALPDLPTIRWAQSVLAMRDLAFLEIDTTGLRQSDEVIRFTLLEADETVIEDLYIRPPCSQLSQEASRANGITPETLAAQGIDIAEAWKRLRAAVSGRYILSYAQDWDREQLDRMSKRHQLEPLTLIGEDLQQRCTQYYNRDYYLNRAYHLSLSTIAERIGYPLPKPPEQTAIHRALAQIRITKALANAVTDVRATMQGSSGTSTESAEHEDQEAEGIDEHPF